MILSVTIPPERGLVVPNMNAIPFNTDRSSRASRQVVSTKRIDVFLASDPDLTRVDVKGVSERESKG